MFDWLRLPSRRRRGGVVPLGGLPSRIEALRRFEVADTTRLNEAHWEGAKGRSINEDLRERWATLVARSTYESANNPYVEGVINTYVTDMVGVSGPKLQIRSGDKKFTEVAERVWRDWWRDPDITGRYSGAELLDLWLRQQFDHGNMLAQFVNDSSVKSGIQLRLQTLNPTRLSQPWTTPRQNVVLGVERTKFGRPVAYWITKKEENTEFDTKVGHTRVPAENILHWFRPVDPTQVIGFPWLTPCLQSCADLRDYGDQVMDAARAAADHAVYMETSDPNETAVKTPVIFDVARRTVSNLLAGWRIRETQGNQPTTRYVEYVESRLRELGRPINMPLMIVQLNSSNHNFSSARFDGQHYQRSNASTAGKIERGVLNVCVLKVLREAQLMELIREIPSDIEFKWTWSTPPHVDPSKEAIAEERRLRNKTLTLTQAAASHGLDLEDIVVELVRERELLSSAGLLTEENAVRMEDIVRAIKSGVPIGVGEARTLGLGLPAELSADGDTLTFNDQDILQYHLETGVLTINEARARLKLPRVDWGDVPVRRQGLETLDISGSAPVPVVVEGADSLGASDDLAKAVDEGVEAGDEPKPEELVGV